MTIHLSDVESIATILASVAAFLGFTFAVLRYIIRAETKELRPNGGGSIKDAIHRIDVRLDEHIKAGNDTETELRTAIANLAEALPVVAASKPPEVP